ncbi:MAG TPA: MMPL family transporter [Solirubrobacterales bacterium]|nr:MMPL family transporter [Solirubrobacterales bacterium]
MDPGRFFERVAAFAVQRPKAVLAVVAIASLGAAAGALTLETNAGTETLVDEDSREFKATERFREDFGGDAAVVLVRQDVRELVLTNDLSALFELETCLAGGTDFAAQLPRRQDKPLPAVCDEIAELAPSKVVYGPATFLYQSVAQIQQMLQGQIGAVTQAARRAGRQAAARARRDGASESEQQQVAEAAAQQVLGQFQGQLLQLALEYDITKPPQLDDPEFISRVVFDPTKPAGTPKERFAYLFPNPEAALVTVRMRPDLSDSERAEAIELFKRAADDERFGLSQGDYVVSGVPAVSAGVADALRSELFLLLAVAVVVMAITLALVFGPPLRLLPLVLALAAAALTFGLLALFGGSLTMASIAVLPVLIGLAVDYAIQFQARFNEARAEGMAPARAATAAAGSGGPVIGAACVATAAGFAALVLSPIPMVRSFGLLLVAGIALAFALAASAGFAAVVMAAWRRPDRAPGAAPSRGGPARGRARAGRRLRVAATRSLAVAIGSPGRVLGAALVLAVCGWIAGTRTEVVSDIRDLAPSSLPALQDVDVLQEETGVSGEVNAVVRSEDLTDPEVIAWMSDFQARVLERGGFAGEAPSCEAADICPAVALTDLFSAAGGSQTREQAQALIEAIPPYFSQAVVTRDPLTGAVGETANIAFGIRVQPLDDQQRLIEGVRDEIDAQGGPPEGTEVDLAGLPVIAAEANADLDRSRYWLPLAGIALVALALLALYRSPRRALVPLVPVVLATGWSALLIAAMGVSLNPMSATLGALVIAIATEFSVLLSARYERERNAGNSVGEALRVTYERTGAAVLASGVTATAGFAALAATDIRMLRDFGLVTVADLVVALVGVLLVLPAALVWAEEGFRLSFGGVRGEDPEGGAPRRRPPRVRGPVGPGAT